MGKFSNLHLKESQLWDLGSVGIKYTLIARRFDYSGIPDLSVLYLSLKISMGLIS